MIEAGLQGLKLSLGSRWHRSRRREGVALAVVLTLGLLSGCGDGRPERVAVSGVVLIDGKPLTHGSVLFVPGQGRPGGGGSR
ncbi:hypothetical protein HG15A2_42990 [Adhaeretor mobilis]|uniref:Uncharacterized protein n=1 Tax=Adhaeretor mobilis TaxID=1930276 RepID=A0A517N1F0_9BACT|nr:hypothetical protein HG15A2_42990 [Adhaeretor mobilis]